MKTIGISLLLWTTLLTIQSQGKERQARYTLGVVPQFEALTLSKVWSPILEEIEKRSGIHLKFSGTSKIPVFEKAFSSGSFDFAYMNPYHMLVAHRKQGYTPLIRDGNRKLYGIIVVRNGSKIMTINDLARKKIAFPAPNALGASLMIRSTLAEQQKISYTPLYSQTHTSSYMNVILGIADAAGGVLSTYEQLKGNFRKQLRIIYETPGVYAHPLVVHPRVPKNHRLLIQKTLIEMHSEEKWKEQIALIPINRPVEASIDDYLPLKSMNLDKYYEE